MIKDKIREILKKAILKLQEKEGNFFPMPDFEVFFSQKKEFGDYSTNLPFLISKFLKKEPLLISQEIKEIILKERESFVFEKIEVKEPGFLNFFLSENFLFSEFKKFLEQKGMFRFFPKKKKRIFIDYFSPNIAKRPSVSHLRSLVIGHTLFKIFNFYGYKTFGCNYLGDWGTQFGNLICNIKRKKIKIKDLTLEEMEKIYVDFHSESKKDPSLLEEGRLWFLRMEKGNREALKIWRYCREKTRKEIKEILKKLNIEISIESGESFFYKKAKGLALSLLKKKIAKKSQGAIIFEFENFPAQILLKSDKTSTYFARDLVSIKERFEKFKPDLMIFEVGSEQKLYFEQLFLASEKIFGFPKDKFFHLAHGLLKTKEGKLSTREGRIVYLNEILEEAKERAKKFLKEEIKGEEREEISQKVGFAGLIFNILKHEPKNDIFFDWENILNLKGDTGPYLQYSFLRAQRILEKSKFKTKKIEKLEKPKIEEKERELMIEILRFPEVIEECVNKISPHFLAIFALNLAKKFNIFYDSLPVLKTKEKKDFRLFLTFSFHSLLKQIFFLFSLSFPKRM